MNGELIYADAFAQYEAGRLADATESFRLLCYQHPLEGKFWFGLAASLQESRSYLDALQAWAVASILQTTDPYPHFHAAECYLSLQNKEDAALALQQAEQRTPNEPLREKIALLREQWLL
ncbi:MAG: tetratricopeptide repeat protein [Chlamydiia bacterium]|nr:tetratricopeptide repeat protein [Chlamydiia bacterium]